MGAAPGLSSELKNPKPSTEAVSSGSPNSQEGVDPASWVWISSAQQVLSFLVLSRLAGTSSSKGEGSGTHITTVLAGLAFWSNREQVLQGVLGEDE